MKTEFSIKVTTQDLYRFLMYHTYHGANGIFSIIAALGLFVIYAVRRGEIANDWIYLLFGVIFLIYLPWTLFTKAAQQVRLGTTFKEPLHYTLTEAGILVQQGEQTLEVKWENIYRVRETGKNILVYTAKKNAFIWVKSQIGGQETAVRRALQEYVPEKKRSLKKG